MRKLSLELDEAAEREFYRVINYYKQFDKSLSSDFIHEFDRAVKRLLKFPDAGSHISTIPNFSFFRDSHMPLFIKYIAMK